MIDPDKPELGGSVPESAAGSSWSRAFAGDWRRPVLAVLGVLTLGVAVLSVVVNYRLLEPRFGGWAYAIVATLDALWVVFQAAEILAGNHRGRAWRARGAGLVLTAVLTAIPAVDLIMTVGGHFELAVVLTPAAIALTKIAWLVALPALGRRVSEATRRDLERERQTVADRLEVMEAQAAHRIELLNVAGRLDQQVAEAETAYRISVLKTQQKTTAKLRTQAASTQKAVAEPLPDVATAIRLPELGSWSALEVGGTAPARAVTQVSAPALPAGTDGGTGDGVPVPDGGTPAVPDGTAAVPVDLADLAAVAGVPLPVPGEPLTDAQMGVVLRGLRYADDPPMSYRQARDQYREAGYVGSEERVRTVWRQVVAQEPGAPATEGASVPDGEDDADIDEESSTGRPAAS